MKKLYVIISLSVLLMVSYNVYTSQRMVVLSDFFLKNIEALANDGENDDEIWSAPRTVSCDLQEGPWHTASVERICELCVTPNSCTPVACGEVFY